MFASIIFLYPIMSSTERLRRFTLINYILAYFFILFIEIGF